MNENQKQKNDRPLSGDILSSSDGTEQKVHVSGSAMARRMIIMLLLTGILFGGIFGFKLFIARMIQKAISTSRQPAVTVSGMKAEYQTWQPRLEAIGTTRAARGVDVTTEVSGLVMSLNFESGEEVEKGQTLVQLNSEADLALLHSLQAQADLSRTNFNREKQQYAIKVVSKEDLDVAAADLKNKEALVAQQNAMVAKKTIRAPFSGRLGITSINPGQYLNPGSKIVTLQDLHSILVDFSIPQDEIAGLKTGQAVSVRTDTYPGRQFNGRITVISPLVDPQSRNIQIEAALDNPQGALLPGMFVTLEIQLGEPQHYLTLPQTAVTYNPYGETVFLIKTGGQGPDGKLVLTVKQTFVTPGETRGDQVAVLKGIDEGDMVVIAGQNKLKNGTQVIINNKIVPSNQGSPNLPDG
jgi:membrane fusion protein (multidrug efflux system)